MVESLTRRDMLKATGATLLLAATGLADERSETMHEVLDIKGAFEGGKYVLPKLPYAYDALEPVYMAKALEIHHQKHHAGYVKGLNTTLEKLESARKAGDYASITAFSRDLAFHGSGHILHCLLWNSMKPGGVKEIPASLSKAINADFGSVDAFKAQFVAATKGVEASGWGVLAFEPVAGKLMILQSEKHQNLTIWGVAPLLVCDVWEHAYYLQYANDRAQWVDNFMKIANWEYAAERYEAVKS